MFSKRHAETDEALDFCKKLNLLLALDSETPQDQLRAATRIIGSAITTWKEEVAFFEKGGGDDNNHPAASSSSSSSVSGGSTINAEEVASPNEINFQNLSSFRFGDDNDDNLSSRSISTERGNNEISENNNNKVPPRSANYFYTVGFLRFRRLAHSRFRLRDIIRKYTDKRRRFIDAALDQWRERELAARVNIDFSQYVLVYVPPELRRQVIVDYHRACAHQCIMFLRATKITKEEQMKLRKSFFIWAYHQRKVSSTTFRISVVALFIFKERAMKRAWVRKLLTRSSTLAFGKNSRVAALLMSGCTAPTRWCRSLLSLQSLAWCSAIRKHALKMITAAKPVVVFKKYEDEGREPKNGDNSASSSASSSSVSQKNDNDQNNPHDDEDQHQDEFARRSSSLLASIKKNNEDSKSMTTAMNHSVTISRSRSHSSSSSSSIPDTASESDSITSTTSAEMNIELPPERIAIVFAPWVNNEVTTTWFSIHLQQFAREIAKVVAHDQEVMKQKMNALKSALNNSSKAKTSPPSTTSSSSLEKMNWSRFLVSPEIFDPFSFVDLGASAEDAPAEKIRRMLISRAGEVDKAMWERSQMSKDASARRQYSFLDEAVMNNQQSSGGRDFADARPNEYVFRGNRGANTKSPSSGQETATTRSPTPSMMMNNKNSNNDLKQGESRSDFNSSFVDVGDDGVLVSSAGRQRKKELMHATFLTSTGEEGEHKKQLQGGAESKEKKFLRRSSISVSPPSSRRKSLLGADPYISPYSQSSFRRPSLAGDGSNNFSFSYSSARNRRRTSKALGLFEDDPFRQAVNSLLRSSSAIHLKSSQSFRMKSGYSDIAVGLQQQQNSSSQDQFVGDTYYDHLRHLRDGRHISDEEMAELARVLAKQSRCPTLWGTHWQTDPHWRGRITNVHATWSPIDFQHLDNIKYMSDEGTAYRRVLRFCIMTGALRITDPYRWRQVDRLNTIMMQEELFRKMREKRYWQTKKDKKKWKQEHGNSNRIPGFRETVLSTFEAAKSMSRPRRNSEIQEQSCELFGELSTIRPNDILKVSKRDIGAASVIEMAQSNKKRLALQPKTTNLSASIVLAPKKPENSSSNINNDDSTTTSRRTPRPLKQATVNRMKSSSSPRSQTPTHHKIVVVDEEVIRQEQTTRNFKVAPPKQKETESVSRKFGSSSSSIMTMRNRRANSFPNKTYSSASKLETSNSNENDDNTNKVLNHEILDSVAVESAALVEVDEATKLVQIHRSGLHLRQDKKKDWTSEGAMAVNEAPEPFGFNVGFPAIWRCVAGKDARSMPSDVKHFK